MIRINLLPTKKIRKQLGIKQEFLAAGLFLVFVVIVLGLLWSSQTGKIGQLTMQKNEKQQKLDQLKIIVAEVEQFKKDKALYEQRIEIIKNLEAQQSGPVHVLDELSLNVPDQLWFARVTLKGSTLTISGAAFANISIVDFVNNLKRSPYFQNVQLMESKLSGKGNVRVYNYKLNASVTIPKS
jgi:type IV pilus assembly protein PilN